MIQRTMLLIIAGILLFSGDRSYCQPVSASRTAPYYWVQPGAGITSLGPGLNGSLTVDIDNHLFTFRTVNTDLSLHGDTWEIAFLYGRGSRQRNLHFSAGVGVAVIGGKKYPGFFGGTSPEQVEPMIAFPLGGEIAWLATRYVAAVLHGFINVNTNQPIGGIGISLRIGKVK